MWHAIRHAVSEWLRVQAVDAAVDVLVVVLTVAALALWFACFIWRERRRNRGTL